MRNGVTVKKFLAIGAAALLVSVPVFAAPEEKSPTSRSGADEKILPLKLRGTEQFPAYFRAALSPTSQARYPGYRPENSVLREGTVRMTGAMPLPCDIMFERDVPIKLRDGVIIYADVFRPTEAGRYPALLCLGTSGKEIGGRSLDDLENRMFVSKSATSALECFNGLDPARWVSRGYAVVNADPRGVCSSGGNISFFGRQFAEDGYDIVEWLALQSWCSGRVAMAGCGELAASQWFVAAEQPPHLEAVAPWGGFSDLYREVAFRGGIPSTAYADENAAVLAGKGMAEDLSRMIASYPFMNAYWEDKAARLEEITVPVYAASFANGGESGAAFDAFCRIEGAEKWLRVLKMPAERALYEPDDEADLAKFFDYYLKDADNGWATVPPVRLAVYDPAEGNFLPRDEEEFPLSDTRETCLYLNVTDGELAPTLPKKFASSGADEKSASFTYRFDKDTELTGFVSLRLWAASGGDDMDIAVKIERLDRDGQVRTDENASLARGKIRASCRTLDENRSVTGRPVLSGTRGMKIAPSMPCCLEIALNPISTIFREGESLRLTILPDEGEAPRPPFGSAKIEIPRDTFTFAPDEQVPMQTLGGELPEREEKSQENPHSGSPILYGGGEYDSYLVLPVIPSQN